MRFHTMANYIDPKANTYNLIEFQSKYSTERACERALFQLKWPDGFICPKCGFNLEVQPLSAALRTLHKALADYRHTAPGLFP